MSFAKWRPFGSDLNVLTHWDRATHRCVSKPSLVQITVCPLWASSLNLCCFIAIGQLGTDFSEVWIKVKRSSYDKTNMNMSCANWWDILLKPQWIDDIFFYTTAYHTLLVRVVMTHRCFCPRPGLVCGYGHCLHPSVCPTVGPSVSVSVYQSWTCPHGNLWIRDPFKLGSPKSLFT